jgi:signal transduction histidine kinase
MRLRSKLLIVILISVLFQAIVSGLFTIQTFLSQSRSSSQAELHSSWRRARFYLEKLKHSSFIHLLSLSNYIQDNLERGVDLPTIERTIRYLKSDIEADRLAVLAPGSQLLIDIQMDGAQKFPAFSRILADNSFAHPTSVFLFLENGSLYLVTGTWVYSQGEKLAFLCLVKAFDQAMVNLMSQELGCSLAFFVGDAHVCSDLPPFTIAEEVRPGEIGIADTPTGRFAYLARVISADPAENVYLVALHSSLEDQIYSQKLLRSFFAAFVVTLLVALILAISMTTYFVSPFTRLQGWIEGYLRNGTLNPMELKTNDEVGYLARSFHGLAETLIREERLIRQQLEEISYLHRYNDNILKNLQAGVLVADSSGLIEYCNGYICRLVDSKSEQLLGIDIHVFFRQYFSVPRDFDIRLDSARSSGGEGMIRSRDKERGFTVKLIPLELSEKEKQTLIVLEDITETERLWEKMAQAEKLASLGLLSAGMAHEINNPLSSILSHVQYLSAVEQDVQKKESLKWIQSETTRIADIVERLRSYAKSEERAEKKADLNVVITETIDLIEHEFDLKSIELRTQLESGLPPVALSTDQLKQVVLNLLVNAVQAVESAGKIIVRSGSKGVYTELVVEDNGRGISSDMLKRVFDPFFTTKLGGQGMGLGLSICYSIVTRAGGEISIRSDGGTAVTVLLPLEHRR